MFIDNVLIPAMQFIFMYGVPILLFGVGVFFLVKIFFMPAFKSGRVKKSQTIQAKVLSKREECVSAYSTGRAYLYYVLFKFEENEQIEFCVDKSKYKKLDYNDKVEITHTGDRLDTLTIIEKSGESTKGETKFVGDSRRSSLNEIPQKKRDN